MSERVKVVEAHQLASGRGLLVRAKGRQIALFNVDGIFYAIDNACPHSGGPLAKGRLFDAIVTCPWHGSRFDVASGECRAEPAATDVRAYPVHVEGDSIFVEIAE